MFADIDPDTHNLDPRSVEKLITPRTTGIIGVHLWGRPAPVTELQAIADRHGLKLMFDAAHAFGCSSHGRSIGNFGACEVLSFHATKVFNTFEGGAVLTNDDELAETMRLMRNFGFSGYDNVIHPGTNGKMPEINAAMGLVNLEAMPEFIEANRRAYEAYLRAERIAGAPPAFLRTEECAQLPVRGDRAGAGFPWRTRSARGRAPGENMLARKYFWPGCHSMQPYCDLFPHAGLVLAETERVADRTIVLPTGTSLPPGSVEVVTGVLEALRLHEGGNHAALLLPVYRLLPADGSGGQFVVYDDVQYTKGGWINRNLIRSGATAKWLTLPVCRDHLELPINQRRYQAGPTT